MEIKLDQNSLPQDGQYVQFQIAIEEIRGKWRKGYYVADQEAIYELDTKMVFDLWVDVVRWIHIDEKPLVNWRNLSQEELEKMHEFREQYSKDTTN